MQLAQQAICDLRDPHIEVFTHINIIYDLYADLVNAEYVTGPPKRIFNHANIYLYIYLYLYLSAYVADILLFSAATRRLLRQHFGLL